MYYKNRVSRSVCQSIRCNLTYSRTDTPKQTLGTFILQYNLDAVKDASVFFDGI